ncbi:ROK family protein [Mucilaginibacter sp. Bleaf8]|uniref:ROK family protein n=1 Tax=Mucilaginibacter sp. Bleaf8 TaxID=2834430 RepID=UPI001BCA8E86|nr:ROK family protein [Mucilaginibacter sp. Bleaf8]MBS7564863.1 ROK family protein [Mucilaginibacter sp. Bleaf8]
MSVSQVSLFNEHSRIVQALYYNESLSSTDISVFIGKSIPHTIKVLNELVKDGCIELRGYASSSGGRRPMKYSLVADDHFIISVAMSQFNMRIAALDMNNRFINEGTEHYFDIHHLQADELIHYINTFIQEAGLNKNNVLGVGITMPGFIDPDKGINYSFLEIPNQSLVEYMQQNIGLPVFIENDSTAIALGEQKFGVARQQNDALIVNLGWGIGLGMIVDGKIFRGHSGLAGEFSHIPIVKNGKLCLCGKHGCLETESSLIAIAAKANAEIEQGQTSSLVKYEQIDADAIIKEAIKGDTLSVKLISEAAYTVGQGIAILIHILNPAVIVLSGKASVVGRLWLSPIQQAINEHCIPRLAHGTELLISDLNDKAQLIGGAVLVVENIGEPLSKKLNELKKEVSI